MDINFGGYELKRRKRFELTLKWYQQNSEALNFNVIFITNYKLIYLYSYYMHSMAVSTSRSGIIIKFQNGEYLSVIFPVISIVI